MRLTQDLPAPAFAVLDRRLAVDSRAPVAVALSGGGDSLALLRMACAWAAPRGRPVLALTVDHGLNPQSPGWAAFARGAALAAGAGWRGLAWKGDKPRAGLPAAARAARHRLLADAARGAGASVILMGHTADDVAEGELMRATDTPDLGRLREWAPSPAWPEGRELFLLRPLLGVRRAALRAWLEAQALAWLEDPANGDQRFARSRARLTLSTAHPGGPQGGAQRQRRDERVGKLARQAETRDEGSISAVRKALIGPDAEPARRFLAAALLCAAGTDRPPRTGELERLRTRIIAGEDFSATLCGARVVGDAGRLLFFREAGERARGGLAPMTLRVGEAVVWDGRFEIEADDEGLTVRPLAGLAARLTPAERKILRRLPASARPALPVLVDADGGVALPRPFGEGPAEASCLVGERLAAACGLIAQEGRPPPAKLGAPHGAGAMVILS